jgi:enoyl-CoA hydratase/carnithine racemase
MEMILTGEPITARRAVELGLVNRVVPPDRVVDTALDLAATITANAGRRPSTRTLPGSRTGAGCGPGSQRRPASPRSPCPSHRRAPEGEPSLALFCSQFTSMPERSPHAGGGR